ncbi:hypothetical protein Q1695_014366 [Nippostrongylus brasiliensis]|nr:hypothetical protein Q1695_014366 [Nippostrongylus brasiliensis]
MIAYSPANFRRLIKAGGGSTVVDECWRTVREKPGKASCVVSAIIIVNGEDIRSHNISLSFIKLLLKQCIPVLYEEMLSQILINQVIPDAEIMVTHAVYYWCNQHPEKLKFSEEDLEEIRILQQQLASASRKVSNWVGSDLLDEMEVEIRKNEERAPCSDLSATEALQEEEQQSIVIVDDGASSCCVIDDPEDDCGLFETIDLDKESERQPTKVKWSDGMATLSYLVPQALARSGVESASFPDGLRQLLDAIVVELDHNLPTSFIHDFICFEAVNSLRNSVHPSLLPTPDILSRFFREIAKPEYGRQFDSSAAVYRLLMFFLYQFPPCNAEARFFWLQVLTGASSSEDEPSESTGRRGSFLNGRSLLSRVNEFRRMILETFTEDGVNHNLMELLVCVLEADLFNLEGCDGLETNKEASDEFEHADRSSLSMRSEDVSVLLEKPQDSSVLDGVSLSYLIFYEPYERRKRGLDKSAMETCMSIIDMALSTNSVISANLCWRLLSVSLEGLQFVLAETVKLFKREQISIDLQIDIERIGRYLMKRGMDIDEIRSNIRIDWICNVIAAMS